MSPTLLDRAEDKLFRNFWRVYLTAPVFVALVAAASALWPAGSITTSSPAPAAGSSSTACPASTAGSSR